MWGVGHQQPAKDGTAPLRKEGTVGEERGGPPGCQSAQPSPPASVPQDWRVSRAGSAGWQHHLHDPIPAPGPQPQPAAAELLPACLPFLPLSPLNRLRQQDGTNLWLNSPKITRDLSKAVCVKLTGACTLLSNAQGSEAGPGPLLRHCPPAPLVRNQSHSPWPCLRLYAGCPNEEEHRDWQRGLGRGSYSSCSPPSPPILLSVWQFHVRAGSPTAGTCVQLAQWGRGGTATRHKGP